MDDFQFLIQRANTKVEDSESRICPTESSADDTLPYLRNHLPYKLRKHLSIYKSYELESKLIILKGLTLLLDISMSIQE